MGNLVSVLLILFTSVILPLLIVMHYTTKWKATKGLSDEEQRLLEELWQDSERMESRVNALETILDDKVPNWRAKL
jgi:phage shock protein B